MQFPHNADVDHVNQAKLEALPGDTVTYSATDVGDSEFTGTLDASCPVKGVVRLKVRACLSSSPGGIGSGGDADADANAGVAVGIGGGSGVVTEEYAPADGTGERIARSGGRVCQGPSRYVPCPPPQPPMTHASKGLQSRVGRSGAPCAYARGWWRVVGGP